MSRTTLRSKIRKVLVIGIVALWCTQGATTMITLSYAKGADGIRKSYPYKKGIEYYHQGELEKAKKILKKAHKVNPENDEVKIYLGIVKAELKMISRAEEPSAQTKAIKVASAEGIHTDNPQYDADYDKKKSLKKKLPFRWPKDNMKAMALKVNEKVYPGKIRGDYKMALGFTSEDVIWKNANGDYNEFNFRMIDHHFPKTNTFDTRVFDRFKVVFDTNEKTRAGVNFHSDITVDPWSFVGRTEKFTISGTPWGDDAEVQLKYWSGTRRTINETFYSALLGDSFATPEIKVKDGKTEPVTISGAISNEFGNSNSFTIVEKEIDFSFQPIRELWFDYFNATDDSHFRFFAFGLEDQALSSDDPLGLSNHHTYWESSPWLNDWLPGHINTGATPNDFWQGQWSNDLAFFTRDSDLKRLTALRGFSYQGNFFDNGDLSMTVASPKTLWQAYDEVTAIPGAIRTKTYLSDNVTLGLIDTFRIGYDAGKTDSLNNVFGVDLNVDVDAATNVVAEVAMSTTQNDRSNAQYKTNMNGAAAHIGLNKETGFGDLKVALTHMDQAFDPGLANYKETRKDLFWSRHIHFKKPIELADSSGIGWEDVKPFRIGDGIDVGRNAFNFRLDSPEIFDGKVDNFIDYRYVRDSEHKYVEGVFREETTLRVNPEWTTKTLLIYHDLPKVKGGIDPILYSSDTGEFLKNTAVTEGADPSVSTYSLGVEYVPEEWISFFGIYENTNDSQFATGSHPNGLLNSTYFDTETIEGDVIRKEVPQLYSQGFFDLPPYDRFHVYKLGVSLKPYENLGIDIDFTKNDFKFAAGIDDNINHFGTTFSYKFNERLTGFLKYTFSKAYNLYRLTSSGDLKYEKHHNVFMEFNYDVTKDSFLTVQYGEGNVVSPVWGATANPYGESYPTLDTRHILRVYYTGEF